VDSPPRDADRCRLPRPSPAGRPSRSRVALPVAGRAPGRRFG
jgi:hypothetical protein